MKRAEQVAFAVGAVLWLLLIPTALRGDLTPFSQVCGCVAMSLYLLTSDCFPWGRK